MRYIVTGGGGFIGSHLARELLLRGHEVKIIDNFISGYRENIPEGSELLEKDLCDYKSVVPHFEGMNGIFHIAALPRIPRSIEDPVLTHKHNIEPTLNVLEACRAHKIPRLVFASSSTVYGDQDRLPLHEDMKPHPISPYGAQKHLCEHYMRLYAMLYNVATVSLRFFSVYGLGMNLEEKHALAIPAFIRARLKNVPMTIFSTGNYTRDCTHVSDVVRAIIFAMESDKVGKGEVINIGAGRNVSINYIAKLIGGAIEYREARKEVKDTHADNSRARELLEWEPKVRIEEGVEEMKNIMVFRKKFILIALVIVFIVVATVWMKQWREKNDALASLSTQTHKEQYQRILSHEESIRKEPNNFEYYNAAGFGYKSLGEATGKRYFFKRALADYQKGLRNKNAKSALFYLNAGNIYRALGDFENADTQYKLAIDLNPGDDVMHRARIELFMAWKEKAPKDVLEVFDIALKTLFFTVNVSLEKAGYLVSLDRYDEALKIYEAVKVAYPDQPNIDFKINEMKEKIRQ